MPAPVVAGRSFVAGIRSDFLGTYRRMYETLREVLSQVMQLDIPSTRRTEIYFFWQSAAHIVRWAYNETLPQKGFKGVRFEVTNHRWAEQISWQKDDRSDDQTNSLLDRARDLGRSAALLDERVLFQIILNSADADLLPSVPNGPDGQALYSTTRDGTNDRFGASGGNIVTGTAATAGPAEANMRTNYFSARERFSLFQDTEGQPLHDQSVIDGAAVMALAADNREVSAQSFQRSVVPEASAGVTNEIRAEGLTPRRWHTQRITTDDYFIFLSNSPVKAVFSQQREPISEVMQTAENSDIARQQDEEGIRFKLRKGYAVAEPYATVQVNNPG